MLVNISMKFLEDILNVIKLQSGHDFVTETATYKAQRGITKTYISSYTNHMQSEMPRPIKIRPRMYVRRSIMYENAAFCSPEEYSL